MRVEVIEQGPYGLTLDPEAPTVNEALPRDTVVAIPHIAGPQGVLDLATLDPQWYVCDDAGSCLLRIEPAALEPCELEFLVPDVPCTMDGGARLELTLGDFFMADEPDAIFSINRAPTVGFVASTDEGPGTETCLRNIGERESLAGCLWMERTLALGSLQEVVDGLALLGYDVEVSESLEPLLGIPRNHNPSVLALEVSIDGGAPTEYAVGETVTVPQGASVRVEWVPTERDVDRYEVMLDGDLIEIEDRLEGRWFSSREVATFEEDLIDHAVTWSADFPDPVTVHIVVRDDRRAEAWGWLEFEVD